MLQWIRMFVLLVSFNFCVDAQDVPCVYAVVLFSHSTSAHRHAYGRLRPIEEI